ncbi:MAG: YkgJ family cysteine cluster protein [Proteobacteria bacterium]|nr:YkgJ family cysteine cluster protein [Pseudomonadota bacterium]
MARVNSKKKPYPEPERLSFPDAEAAFDWLPLILDAYIISDQGIYDSIQKEMAKKGRRLACARGCSSCCTTHVTIPVYPLELFGLYWYLLDKIDGAFKHRILEQLQDFIPGKGCPFLIDGACGIHPMRPMACRFFNVFNKACEDGEDPFYTRRHDVLTPDEKLKDKAISKMLPHHGILGRTDKKEALRNGYIYRFVRNLQEINWPKIAVRIKHGDRAPLVRSTME